MNLQSTTTDGRRPDEWSQSPYRPRAGCSACKGYGFVHPLDDSGNTMYNRSIPCTAPGCMAESVKAYLSGEGMQVLAHATPKGQTFENFTVVQGQNDEAYKQTRAWCEGRAKNSWLIIYGTTGNGKSHLCAAAHKALIGRVSYAQCRHVSAAQFIQDLRMAMNEHKTDEVMRAYQEVFYLILDDLGQGTKPVGDPGSEWEWARFEDLLVARYEWMRPTMIGLNLNIKDLPDRIASRFNDKELARLVLNRAPDYRRQR